MDTMKKDSKRRRETMVCVSYIKWYCNSSGLSAIVIKSSAWNNIISQQEMIVELNLYQMVVTYPHETTEKVKP